MATHGTSLQAFLQRIEAFEQDATPALRDAASPEQLEVARIRFLGDRAGLLKEIQKELGALAKEDKPAGGRAFNEVKTRVAALLEERARAITVTARGAASTGGDLTMPSRQQWVGAKHPVTLVIEEIADIFRALGFTIALGPQVETEWYNFGALNFPPDHPAMDAHDTLYVRDDILLRTHTSPVQIRTLQQYPPPIRILAPGDVFRRDFFDASHAPMFAQIEGLCIDEGISFVDLKAMLTNFARRFFGSTKTRFRPSYFPFTEPSAEMDVECQLCKGAGCPVCKQTGWTEILGSGMVHPSVLESAGVDPERYTGWAFGMGPARIALQRYDIPDIRILYDSDARFLEQIATPARGGKT
ncbi:MAG TPA: phenylalanine--tRNA ligase subunit alpha [Gemmatimonadaceae bacterium]|nr:phenylalanine--tRNA ligase subunit alpha [Gemmatimonadaceae bacterium]